MDNILTFNVIYCNVESKTEFANTYVTLWNRNQIYKKNAGVKLSPIGYYPIVKKSIPKMLCYSPFKDDAILKNGIYFGSISGRDQRRYFWTFPWNARTHKRKSK